jgi:hypothetical protein
MWSNCSALLQRKTDGRRRGDLSGRAQELDRGGRTGDSGFWAERGRLGLSEPDVTSSAPPGSSGLPSCGPQQDKPSTPI